MHLNLKNGAFLQAEAFKQQLTTALERLCALHSSLDEYEQAIIVARRWLALDTLREEAHQQLMRLYAWSGNYAAALRQYKEVTRILEAELRTQPDAETTALNEAIQARRLPLPIQEVPPTEQADAQSTFVPMPMPHVKLPAQMTPFIGRINELTEIARLLDDPACRLLTLIGQGGIGKTRLAIQAAQNLADAFIDGVYFISLASVWYPEFVVQTIAAETACFPASQEDVKGHLLAYLRDKQMLLVIDNFEHLLDASGLLSDILAHAPEVKILVTSREQLNLHEEWLFETGGLSFPLIAAQYENPSSLEDFGAVRLFVQSARRVRPDFTLSDPESVVRICWLVEGMPLGIELAATWVQVLSCAEIAAEIQKGLDFLATSMRNVPERHRSLRAVFEYSWDGLDAQEQISLRRLSIFMGGFRYDATQAVAGASLHILRVLVSKSLLRRNPFLNGRYEMHELLRQYAEGKLTPDENTDARMRHAVYFGDFLDRLAVALKSADEPQALDEFQRDLDNIRQAWHYAAAHRLVDVLAKSLDALMIFYSVRVRYEESEEMLRKAIEALRADSDDPAERLLLARLLAAYATNVAVMGRRKRADTLTEKSLELLHEFKGQAATAFPLLLLGLLKNIPGRKDPQARELVNEALSIYETTQDKWGIALALYALGGIEHNHVEYDLAREHLERSFALMSEVGQPGGMAEILGMLAESAFTLGQYEVARGYLQQALPLWEAIDNRVMVTMTQAWLEDYTDSYDSTNREATLKNALKIYEEMGDRRRMVWTFYNLGWNSYFVGEHEDALIFQEKAQRIFHEMQDIEGESWTMILRASIELRLEHYADARDYAHQSLAIIQQINFPWALSGAHYVLGDIALALGELEEARQYFTQAIHEAYDVQSIMQTLRHLSGLAALLLREEVPEQAVCIAFFLVEHPASEKDTLKRAMEIIDEATWLLPPADLEAARRAGKSLTLETALAAYVRNSTPSQRTIKAH